MKGFSRFFFSSFLLLLFSCARPSPNPVNIEGPQVYSETVPEESLIFFSTPPNMSERPNMLGDAFFKSIEKISIEVSSLELVMAANRKAKETGISYSILRGGAGCSLHFQKDMSMLAISEAKPLNPAKDVVALSLQPLKLPHHALPVQGPPFRMEPPYAILVEDITTSQFQPQHTELAYTLPQSCHFLVEIQANEAKDLSVEARRGTFQIEDWKRPIELHLEVGDVALREVSSFDIQCNRCNLAGEHVEGPLKFDLEVGNVGIEGLTESVEGKTLGDIVLEWKKYPRNAEPARIHTKMGDAILSFPRDMPINMDVKALRGELSTKISSAENGYPISVVADAGNVRLLRSK